MRPTGDRPKRSLGQHFLVDPHHQRAIVEAAGFAPDDLVLEIGPGRGALTRHLVGRVAHLVLVELDDALARHLEGEYGAREDVEVMNADLLSRPLAGFVPDPASLRVIGNIPYNITAPILFHLLERPRPRDAVLLVQREVAERILAPPGTGSYGALSIGIRTVAEVERLHDVPRGAFRPVPKVDSTLIRVVPIVPPPLSPDDERRVRGLTRALFQWRRKQLGKILRDHPDLGLDPAALDRIVEELQLDLSLRPEALSPDQIVALAHASR